MPVITFKSRDQSPGSEFLETVAQRVAALLDQRLERVWVLWEAIGERNYHKPDWKSVSASAAPIVEIWHRDSYSQIRLAEVLQRLPEWCAELLKCNADDVFVRTFPVHPMEVFTRGEFLNCCNISGTDHVYDMVPIGFVSNGIKAPVDEGWGRVCSTIKLNTSLYRSQALNGLSDFSHLEIVFVLHRASQFPESLGERYPRGRRDLPTIGVLSQRCKDRVNRIGVSTCKLLSIDGDVLKVEGLDAINGSPVLDIKPLMRAFLPKGVTGEPQWAGEIMKDYF